MPEDKEIPENSNPHGNEDADKQGGDTPSGMFRRRRDMLGKGGEDNSGQPSSPAAQNDAADKQEPSATPAAPQASAHQDTALPTDAGGEKQSAQTMPRRNVAPAQGEKPAPAAKAGASKAVAEEVPPARRALRFILIAGILFVCWLGLVMNLKKMRDQKIAAEGTEALTFPASPEEKDFSAGNKVATDYEQNLLGGDIDGCASKAGTLRSEYKGNSKVMRVTFMAEAAKAVVIAGKSLDDIPVPDPRLAPAKPLQESIDILAKRITLLRNLDALREDWSGKLEDIGEVANVYEKYSKEITEAPKLLDDWTAALASVKRAAQQIKNEPPAFDECSTLLRSAWSFLPMEVFSKTARNSEFIGRADYLLKRGVVDRAVKSMKSADLAGTAVKVENGAAAPVIAEIQSVLEKNYAEIEKKVGEWDKINTAMTDAKVIYDQGKPAEALAILDKAEAAVNPNAPLTRSIAAKLKTIKKHYEIIRTGWESGLKAKAEKGLGDQLTEWGAFQKLLKPEDVYYQTAFINELREIKVKIRDLISEHYQNLDKIAKDYRRISLNMRKPESARGPFAEQAKILSAMAIEAQAIKDTADLVPGWNLGDETSQQVDYAATVLADHNDQARRLNNLYQLYRGRGKPHLARECLVRIQLLGKASSNPWFTEADNILSGRQKESSVPTGPTAESEEDAGLNEADQ
ncbi:MAG: hypothetical protein JXR97_02945 [Planctomycetes bacterium]|nr:hypothetical protein [Planctomycetota bacterium]